jgi:hypothetical protein
LDKRKFKNKQRIISAEKTRRFNLIDVKIFHLDKNSNLIEKIVLKKLNIKIISGNLKNVSIFKI